MSDLDEMWPFGDRFADLYYYHHIEVRYYWSHYFLANAAAASFNVRLLTLGFQHIFITQINHQREKCIKAIKYHKSIARLLGGRIKKRRNEKRFMALVEAICKYSRHKQHASTCLPPSRSPRGLRVCCVCWMKRVRACGLPSKCSTRGCRRSWRAAPPLASPSPPRMETGTRRQRTRVPPSPSATTLDRCVCQNVHLYWIGEVLT